MQIQQRQAFNSRLVTWCIDRSGWEFNEQGSQAKNDVKQCLRKVLAAQQIYRAQIFRSRPGIPVPYRKKIDYKPDQ